MGPGRNQLNLYSVLATLVDLVHVSSMLAWGLGLPLLVWHRFPRLSRAYMWFAVGFVLISVGSHYVLGECVLSTLARGLWRSAGSARDAAPFIGVLVQKVAGLHPSNRKIVLVWELAVLGTSIGSLWCWARTTRRRYAAP